MNETERKNIVLVSYSCCTAKHHHPHFQESMAFILHRAGESESSEIK
jgi:hypothetical protein